MTLVLDFHAEEALDPALSGGKGSNLSRLTQAGLPVPEGLVLTARAYEQFAEQARACLDQVSRFDVRHTAQLQKQCEALQAELGAISMPAAIQEAIDAALARFPAGTAFSVRSSATTEDLGGAAFAGQHETYLNCIGSQAIAERIKDCWISLWSDRAVAYRCSANFEVADTRMAVVVQRMVFCDVAGVGFSMNPISGSLAEQVFDANYGLGESVVSGEAEVDHFTVRKADGEILAQAIAEKRIKVAAKDDGNGVQEIALSADESRAACLSPDQVRKLADLLRRVEQLYGYPQDIEWGFAGDRLWLLQSRPITRIPARWTRDESAERFPSVITPLAWALVEEGFHRSLNHSFELMGLPPFKDKWFAMFDHYVYGNQTAVEVYAQGAASNIHIRSLEDLRTALPALRKQYGWVQELPLAWSRDLDHYLITLGELMAEPLDGRPLPELWDYVLRVKELGAEYFLPNIAISITQRTLYRILHGLLQMLVGKDQAANYFDRLLAYCETKTGVINKELYRLAKDVATVPPLAERLRQTDARRFLAEGGFQSWPALNVAFAKFLRDHGHREVEFDPYHPTWVEAPWLVVDNLKAMLDSRLDDPAEKERELKILMRQTEEALIARLPEDIRFFVHEVVRLARVYTTLDDVEHYQTTRLTLPFRRGLKAVGRILMGRGVVAEPMDVFFADYQALDTAVNSDDPNQWRALGDAIRAEKVAYLKHRCETPPHILGQEDATAEADGDGLSGLPGSPGCASGPVYKVFGSEDFAAFPPGAVLVARTTNPAWTPLFYKAAAVITESGGPLSHGAVTAREIGLPAVMAVKGVLSKLDNGQRVEVDGGRGQVRLSL